MENIMVPLPDVEKISKLIAAIADYAVRSAREQWAQKMSSVYVPPRLRCWEECSWFELEKDRQVVEFLLSDQAGAWVLMRSLHFCLRVHGQAEIDRLQSMSMVIESHQE